MSKIMSKTILTHGNLESFAENLALHTLDYDKKTLLNNKDDYVQLFHDSIGTLIGARVEVFGKSTFLEIGQEIETHIFF
jgi:hypothetical protein